VVNREGQAWEMENGAVVLVYQSYVTANGWVEHNALVLSPPIHWTWMTDFEAGHVWTLFEDAIFSNFVAPERRLW
jgi:hypothetical protein